MYSVIEFESIDALLDHQEELERIFKDRMRYILRSDIDKSGQYYKLITKIAIICPN
jgi:hypothetical protein